MLTLAYLIQQNPRWREHSIRLLRVVEAAEGRRQAENNLNQMVEEFRVQAQVITVVSKEPPLQVIARTSENSEVCFVGISMQALADKDDPLQRYDGVVAGLKGNVFLTKSWHDLEL